ncbi:MAG: aminomethyl-transferring glycine dehydrogenase subunit GcvPB [Ferrimicrobium sp.]|jgi:glycine dehydrogenase subunit 2|nr:aminomethyl-transferring glycine dehydrogenase subunit GcvPB [Ferrimicrobium sp.]
MSFLTHSAAGGKASSAPLVGDAEEPTIFELSVADRRAYSLRDTEVPEMDLTSIGEWLREEPVGLPEVSERDLVGHFTRLASRNYSVDLGAYPLGSCTMKYNPKFADQIASIDGLANVHPLTPPEAIQGWLRLLNELEHYVCEMTGMAQATLQPPAGASGELTGLLIMRAYHAANGRNPSKIVIPDSAHGTNPASVSLAGFEAVTVPSGPNGLVDLAKLRALVDDDTAGIMLTNPNTLGLFEQEIQEILAVIHAVDGLAYYDGANLNAIVGVARPGDMGFDIVHSNLHKTFATPHGGGGPGAGPVAVVERLVDFLPGPIPRSLDGGATYLWVTPPRSIGRVHAYYGNAVVLARALAFMRYLGRDGLKRMSELAVLNANWLKARIASTFDVAYEQPCMHEFVVSAEKLKTRTGVRALDVAKALLDAGFHAPTVYFPLVVHEALMIEPTETESPQTLEALARAFEEIVEQAKQDPRVVLAQPQNTPVRRLDEARAARNPILTEDGRH